MAGISNRHYSHHSGDLYVDNRGILGKAEKPSGLEGSRSTFLLYSNRFKRGAKDPTIPEESHTDRRTSKDDNERLLETDGMEKLEVKLQIRFQWPGDGDTKAEATLRRRKGARDVDVDSLLQE